jgi:hypothetical protein
MSILDSLSKKRYMVVDDILDRVFIVSNNDLYHVIPDNHHKFSRMIDAQKYRLAELYYYHKVRSNNALATECFNKLKHIEEEHPEWLI